MSDRSGRSEFGPDQHYHSRDPQQKADFAALRDVVIAKEQAVQHEEPERRYRDQKSGQAGGNNSLGIGEREIAAHQQEDADDRHVKKFARRMEDAASGERAPGEHHDARDCKASGAHQGGRNVLDGDADAEIS